MSTGMKNRLGDNVQPSIALLGRHIHWIDNILETQFHGCFNPRQQATVCRGAVGNLMGWMGWLRGGEQFHLRWCDTTVVSPASGLTVGLPPGMGMVALQLLEQTKSAQSFRADVIVAFSMGPGLSLGTWIERLRTIVNPHSPTLLCAILRACLGTLISFGTSTSILGWKLSGVLVTPTCGNSTVLVPVTVSKKILVVSADTETPISTGDEVYEHG